MKTGLKKKDWLLILIILCVAGLTVLAHTYIGGRGANKVVVKVDGVIQGTYSLSEDGRIEINDGTNVIEISNGKADMIKADCPDQLCVNQKAVSRNHENIICLPNKVVVTIESSEDSVFDAVAQ